MKETKSIIIALVLAAVLTAGFFCLRAKNTIPPLPEKTGEAEEAAAGNVFLTISFSGQSTSSLEIAAQDKLTAFDVLQKAAEALGLGLETKDYGEMGVLVEKLGDKKNGDSGNYWMYYVNGKLAPVAANKQEVKAGDRVEWRFEKPSF